MKSFNLIFDGYYSDSVRLVMNGACGELFGTTICIDVKRMVLLKLIMKRI